MHLALRQSTGPNSPLASEAASPRAEPGAVVSIEQALNVSVSAVTSAAANPLPGNGIFPGMTHHSSVRNSAQACECGDDYTECVYIECIVGSE